MSLKRTLTLTAVIWVSSITLLHAKLNLKSQFLGGPAQTEAKFRVGFLPVTCHLTCPVTDFINRKMTGEGIFAEQIEQMFNVACRRAGIADNHVQLSTAAFRRPGPVQLGLFD